LAVREEHRAIPPVLTSWTSLDPAKLAEIVDRVTAIACAAVGAEQKRSRSEASSKAVDGSGVISAEIRLATSKN